MTFRFTAFAKRVWKSAMLMAALGTVIRVGSNIIVLPLALRFLSEEEMVVWWAFVALGELSNLADFGFTPAITRAYSFIWGGASDYITEGMPPTERGATVDTSLLLRLHATVRRLYGFITVGLFALLAIGGTLYLAAGPMPALEDPRRGWITWAVFALSVCLNLRLSYWELAATGINQVRDVQRGLVWGGSAYLVIGASLLFSGAGLLSLAFAFGARALLSRQVCKRAFEAKVDLDASVLPDPEILRRLWPNAWKFGAMSIGGYLVNYGLVLIGIQILPVHLAQAVGLTQQLGRFITSLSTLWLQVKWPELTILRTQGHLRELSVLFARRLSLCLASFAVMACGLVLLGQPLLNLLGTDKAILDSAPLVFYLTYLGWQFLYIMFGLLVFTQNIVPFYILSIVTGAISLMLTLVLGPRFGLWGLLAAPFIVDVGWKGWYIISRGFQAQSLRTGPFLVAMLGGRPDHD